MGFFRKKVYAAAGYNSTYFGSGRREFDPKREMPSFESYLLETAQGTMAQIAMPAFDEGIIASFMSGRFLKQANLPGFLPFIAPSLLGKPCSAVEGACGSGGRAIAMAVRAVLAELADIVFVAAFEMQNVVKAVYAADIIAGAGYYRQERKGGHAYFFPNLFSERAGAYGSLYGEEMARRAMAQWYEQSILNARLNPKAQEYHNSTKELFALGMTPPDPRRFLAHLNQYDCSKISDGASSILIGSEVGLAKCGISVEKSVEIVAIGEAEGDITRSPSDLTSLATTSKASATALKRAEISIEDLALLEIHDCFTITALLSLEAIGVVGKGQACSHIIDGHCRREGSLPTNLSGGLMGFGHPTGATGVRQLVDLQRQLTGSADGQLAFSKPFGMMVSMGGNDITVTALVVKAGKSSQ